MRIRFTTILLAAVILFAACGNAEIVKPGASVVPENSSEQGNAASSLPMEQEKDAPIDDTENKTSKEPLSSESSNEQIDYTDSRKILYRFIPESGLYDVNKLLDLDYDYDCNDIFNLVTDELFPNHEIPAVNSMTLNKSYFICDLSEEWLDTFNKGQLYEFCNTLAMTLIKSGYCESVGFRIDGKIGLLGDEVWSLAELKVLEGGNAEQFSKIREAIPYTGLAIDGAEHYFDFSKALKKDNKAVEISRLLKLAGELTNEFEHPSDNDMRYAVQYLIWATEPVDIDANSEDYNVDTAQTIMPVAASVSQRLAMQENCFWLKEHIEQTAKTVYGDDIVIVHQDPIYPYRWFETEGVYTPPHMGGAGKLIPHLYSYTDMGGVITAEVAYLKENMQGIYIPELDKTTESYDEVDNYLLNTATRHKVKLQRADDGRLTVRSHHLY